MPSWANSDSWLVDDDEDIDGQRQGGRHARDGAAAAASKGGENAIVLSGPPGCGKTAAVVACAQVCAPTWPLFSRHGPAWSALLGHMLNPPFRGTPPLNVYCHAHTHQPAFPLPTHKCHTFQELGLDIIEVNASSERTGAQLLRLVGEATQSRRLAHMIQEQQQAQSKPKGQVWGNCLCACVGALPVWGHCLCGGTAYVGLECGQGSEVCTAEGNPA